MQPQLKSTAFTQPERGDVARKKLIGAGLKIFSELGYEGASTRALAKTAGVNIAAIPYYFGGKEGLYLAVIDYMVDYFQGNIGRDLARIRQTLETNALTSAQCQALLDEYIHMLVYFILQESEECSQVACIYIYEQLNPTPAFDRLHEGFIRNMREILEKLVFAILGMEANSTDVKLIAQTLLGQVTIFKTSRASFLLTMDWENYGERYIAEIERIVLFNVHALMQAHKKIEKSNE